MPKPQFLLRPSSRVNTFAEWQGGSWGGWQSEHIWSPYQDLLFGSIWNILELCLMIYLSYILYIYNKWYNYIYSIYIYIKWNMYIYIYTMVCIYIYIYRTICEDIWRHFITLGIMGRKNPGVPRPGLHWSLQSINSGLPETGPEPGKPETDGPRPQSNASRFIKSIINCIPNMFQKYPNRFSMPVLSVMFYLGTIASCPI